MELLCIPPQTSHPLQPLDKDINKSLQTKWHKEIFEYLRQSDRAVLTRDSFHIPFVKTWKNILDKRGMIFDSFRYCGLYALKNTVSEVEYSHRKSFSDSPSCQSMTRNEAKMIK